METENMWVSIVALVVLMVISICYIGYESESEATELENCMKRCAFALETEEFENSCMLSCIQNIMPICEMENKLALQEYRKAMLDRITMDR